MWHLCLRGVLKPSVTHQLRLTGRIDARRFTAIRRGAKFVPSLRRLAAGMTAPHAVERVLLRAILLGYLCFVLILFSYLFLISLQSVVSLI